jgi:hypothetical protein
VGDHRHFAAAIVFTIVRGPWCVREVLGLPPPDSPSLGDAVMVIPV